ncbi:MAG: hypothetical protein ACFFD7_17035 [Candidatus Thorarchaeota archaeon]
MSNNKKAFHNDKRIIIPWLAHHNPDREDFNDHVFYIFDHAICIGCSAFIIGVTVALILGNIFYLYIASYFNFFIVFFFFLICWIPSVLQYSIQILRKRLFTNRVLKFVIRFLYPFGSIILIFKSPLLGFGLAIPAGYLILYIRKLKVKALES